ncbi:MAG: GTPase ObgE, partial [Deltaproteobacteria bacterium]
MSVEFLDEVVIKVKSGDGGNGCISFRREKYVPKGGPDGGDGGKGGDVILKANSGIYSLSHFAFKKFFEAKRGAHGRGKNCSGKDGESLVLEVPVGTVVKDEDTGEIIADLTQDGQQVVVAKGGRGGRGNQHFATATCRVPRIAEPGEPGQERRIRLIL